MEIPSRAAAGGVGTHGSCRQETQARGWPQHRGPTTATQDQGHPQTTPRRVPPRCPPTPGSTDVPPQRGSIGRFISL